MQTLVAIHSGIIKEIVGMDFEHFLENRKMKAIPEIGCASVVTVIMEFGSVMNFGS